MILSLEELEFVFDPVTGLGHSEFKSRLPGLMGSLEPMRTTQGRGVGTSDGLHETPCLRRVPGSFPQGATGKATTPYPKTFPASFSPLFRRGREGGAPTTPKASRVPMTKCREGDLEDLGEGYEEGVKVPHPRQAALAPGHSSAITLGPLLRPPQHHSPFV